MMEKANFRSISLRDSVYQLIEDFIESHPDFVAENPECKSVAGFMTKAGIEYIKKLKGNGNCLDKLKNAEEA